MNDEIMEKYPQYKHYIERVYLCRRNKWAHCYRLEECLPTHSNNTNNYVETSFRSTKDQQFGRCKAYNLVELLQILLDDSELLKNKLVMVGTGRLSALNTAKSKYNPTESKIRKDQIIEICSGYYLVESQSTEDKFYTVNFVSGLCECKIGSSKGPCPHKMAITYHFGVSEFNYLPKNDPKQQAMYHFLALGEILNDKFYRPLKTNPGDDCIDVASYVEDHVSAAGPSQASAVQGKYLLQGLFLYSWRTRLLCMTFVLIIRISKHRIADNRK